MTTKEWTPEQVALREKLLPKWRELLPAYRNLCDQLQEFENLVAYHGQNAVLVIKWQGRFPVAAQLGNGVELTLEDAAPAEAPAPDPLAVADEQPAQLQTETAEAAK